MKYDLDIKLYAWRNCLHYVCLSLILDILVVECNMGRTTPKCCLSKKANLNSSVPTLSKIFNEVLYYF